MNTELTATKNHVVSFHYVLSNADGLELESSESIGPVAALLGHRTVMPGLEAALEGRRAGERFEVTLSPEEGFGERREGWVQRVQKKRVPGAKRLRPGMITELQTDQGPRTVTVVKVGSSVLDVDLNHPWAGLTVNFAVEVTAVREATAEELAHGHAHGEGGHQH